MQKIRNFEWPVLKKMSKNPNFRHLIHLNPQIKILFQNSGRSITLLDWPPTSCKVSEKTNELCPRYLKMDQQTNEGDDYGVPSSGSKIWKTNWRSLMRYRKIPNISSPNISPLISNTNFPPNISPPYYKPP